MPETAAAPHRIGPQCPVTINRLIAHEMAL